MKFRYSARTKKGERKLGTLDALNAKEAKNILLNRDLIVISITPIKLRVKRAILIPFLGGVSFLDKLLFAKHLSLMLRSGLPLRESIAIIKEQSSGGFKIVLGDILLSIDNGYPLERSLARHSKVFNPFYINMIKAGEEAGSLDENLEYLSLQMEKIHALRNKVRAAMIYPFIILASVTVLAAAIILFVLPRITPVFKSFRIQLPLATRILISIAGIIENYGLYILLGIILFLVLLVALYRIRFSRYLLHQLILRVPVFGVITKGVHLASFSRNLSTLLKSGIPVVEALNITAETQENLVYRQELIRVMEEVKKGKAISDYIRTRELVFPIMVSRMIEVGEKTGNLEEVLMYLSDFYDLEVDRAAKNISSFLEPMLLIAIGVVVGFIALAIITPIYEVTKGLRL